MTEFSIDRLVADALEAAGGDDPVQALTELLAGLAGKRKQVLQDLPTAHQDETILHSSESLTLVQVEVAPGMRFPPHEHAMPAILAILSGEERNTYYRETDDGVIAVGQEQAPAGSVLTMTSTVIHSVSNHGIERSVGIHAYLGELFAVDRSIWDLRNGEKHPYSDEVYFSLASSV